MGFAEQARIQEQHRAAQTRLQAIVAADTARVFPLLDVNNLDKSFGGFVDGMRSVVNARRTVSASLGASCFTAIRKDAGIVDNFIPALASSVPSDKFFTSMLVTGPISMKKNMAAGMDPMAARDASLRSTIRANQRHVADGGRGTILNAVKSDRRALGWARLTDGRPCAFCALLASRGPAYKSEGTSSFRSHDGCGCTAVPVFDLAAPWPGRAQEFRDAYDANISGKYPGGDGNNKAVQAWRKHYDVSFDGSSKAAASMAKTVEQAVESSEDWLKTWQNLRAELPENTATIGRVGARELTASEAATLASANERRVFIEDWVERWNRNIDAKGTLADALRAEYTQVTGSIVEGRLGILTVQSDLRAVRKEITALDNIQRGNFDFGPDIRQGVRTVRSVGDTANSHLDGILNAGKVLGDELDARIARRVAQAAETGGGAAEATAARVAIEKKLEEVLAKRDAAREALRGKATQRVDLGFTIMGGGTREEQIEKLMSYLARSERSISTLDNKARLLARQQRDAIALEEKLAKAGISPGTPAYSQIVREETLAVLNQIRSMGGEGAKYLRSGKVIKSGELIDAMDFAHASYPTSWLERARKAFPEVDLGATQRGFNQGGTKIRLSRGKLQMPGDTGYNAVAVHELGHSMEYTIDGLKEMEWAYHSRRAITVGPNGPEMEIAQSMFGNERSIFDSWREKYTGKVYDGGPSSSWEVFTTGVESLMSGSSYLENQALGFDKEFRDFLMGVMSVL